MSKGPIPVSEKCGELRLDEYFDDGGGFHYQTSQITVEQVEFLNLFECRSLLKYMPRRFKWKHVAAQTIVIDVVEKLDCIRFIRNRQATLFQQINLVLERKIRFIESHRLPKPKKNTREFERCLKDCSLQALGFAGALCLSSLSGVKID